MDFRVFTGGLRRLVNMLEQLAPPLRGFKLLMPLNWSFPIIDLHWSEGRGRLIKREASIQKWKLTVLAPLEEMLGRLVQLVQFTDDESGLAPESLLLGLASHQVKVYVHQHATTHVVDVLALYFLGRLGSLPI